MEPGTASRWPPSARIPLSRSPSAENSAGGRRHGGTKTVGSTVGVPASPHRNWLEGTVPVDHQRGWAVPVRKARPFSHPQQYATAAHSSDKVGRLEGTEGAPLGGRWPTGVMDMEPSCGPGAPMARGSVACAGRPTRCSNIGAHNQHSKLTQQLRCSYSWCRGRGYGLRRPQVGRPPVAGVGRPFTPRECPRAARRRPPKHACATASHQLHHPTLPSPWRLGQSWPGRLGMRCQVGW
jgi:hypothetical protein